MFMPLGHCWRERTHWRPIEDGFTVTLFVTASGDHGVCERINMFGVREPHQQGQHPRNLARSLVVLRAPSLGGPRGQETPFEGARSQNIENNPMQSSGRPAWMLRKQVDTSGKSGAFLHHPAIP
jgi:hypothetical protein